MMLPDIHILYSPESESFTVDKINEFLIENNELLKSINSLDNEKFTVYGATPNNTTFLRGLSLECGTEIRTELLFSSVAENIYYASNGLVTQQQICKLLVSVAIVGARY
jgi:hypothetical protein